MLAAWLIANVSFTGTIRENIDPFEQYSDTQVWDALGKRCPAATIMSVSCRHQPQIPLFVLPFDSGVLRRIHIESTDERRTQRTT